MHDPCLCSYIVHCAEVCSHQVGEVAFALLVWEDIVGESTVVVRMERRFMKVPAIDFLALRL